jgi:hypothetical protein
MALNPPCLARAVVHWTEFETSCRRGNLLSEAQLSQPIGQVLNANSVNPVVPEFPHPLLNNGGSGRPKAIDFVIQTRNESVITHAIETKWITDKRDFKQELFDDLARLELVHVENRPLARWLLIAGRYSHIRDAVFDAEGNSGPDSPRAKVFDGVLPSNLNTKVTVPIRDAILPAQRYWKKTNKAFGIDIAISLTVRLEGVYPEMPVDDSIACFVWQVGRVGRRNVFSFVDQ